MRESDLDTILDERRNDENLRVAYLNKALDKGRYVENDGIKDFYVEGQMIVVEDTDRDQDLSYRFDPMQYPNGIRRGDIKYLIKEGTSRSASYDALHYWEEHDGVPYMILKWDESEGMYIEF